VSTAVTAGVDYDTLVDIPDLVYRQGNDLKTMQHDGSDKNAIGLAGLEPRWSADAKKIAYVYAYDIYTVNRDGSDRKQHTFEGSSRRTREPAWSPDGQKIVCTRDGNLHVITLGSDGHTESMRWITSAATGGAEDSAPAWSPDGSRIAFIRAQDGGRELYFVNPDGTGVTQKTNTPENEYDPDWHPNGNGIVLSYTDGGSDHNVRFISYAGFFPFAADILTNEHMDDRSPSFSPDGTRIAFQRKIQGFIFRTDVYTCTIAGSQQVNLTNLSGDIPANLAGTPDWR
jgi:TolB protein